MRVPTIVLLLFAVFRSLAATSAKKPNIIVIVADDMGSNDVGFHGSNEIPTPNIDALAYNGVILNNHYTQALCTPSRAAFLTGKYPIHLGMQHLVILEPEPWGLPLNETLLPQHLKQNGYKTHAVGKWHLGFYKKEYTPTYRGFDTHFGYWQGLQDYYEHTVHATFSSEFGYDMRRNMTVDWDAKGKYSTTLFTEEAVKLIKEHDTSNPMFMYFAHLAPHSGNDHNPMQAPDDEIAKFSHIADPERRIYAAMVSLLDQSVGKVVTALRERHMLENSIILFLSDNGGKTEGTHANHGSNYPLRGMKNSPWEGAMRNIAAIWSPLIKQPQRVSNEMMHISDWLPTIYAAAGLNATELGAIDGKDVWKSISEGAKSPRTDFVYNIDDIFNTAAIRQGDWKYVFGTIRNGRWDQWYGSQGRDPEYTYTEQEVLTSPTATALSGIITYQQIKEKSEQKDQHHVTYSINLLTEEKVKKLRNESIIHCPKINVEDQPVHQHCYPLKSPCLFNIKEDPCEMVNLASTRPLIVVNLEEALLKARKTMRQPINVPRDPNADPAKWNGTWTNWGDHEEVSRRKIYFEYLSPLTVALISAACLALLVVLTLCVILSCKKSTKSKLSTLFQTIEDPLECPSSNMMSEVTKESNGRNRSRRVE